MKIYSTFNNKQMEVALIRALARVGKEAEYTGQQGEADVLVVVAKGKGFGQNEIEKLLQTDKPRVLVTDKTGVAEVEGILALVTAVQEGGKLKILMSDIASAVLKVAPVEFIIEDDEMPINQEPLDLHIELTPPPVDKQSLSLKERMALVINQDQPAMPPIHNAFVVSQLIAQAENICLLVGVKGGVGTSTVAAMVNHVFKDYGSIHLEIADTPSASIYYAPSLDEAVNKGQYAFSDGYSLRAADIRRTKLLLIDMSKRIPAGIADSILSRNCKLLITDREEISFNMTRGYLQDNLIPDIVIVSRTFPGMGNGQEVYEGEYMNQYGIKRVISVPGTLDVERAITAAQRKNILPCGISPDLDYAAGEIAAAIRKILKI